MAIPSALGPKKRGRSERKQGAGGRPADPKGQRRALAQGNWAHGMVHTVCLPRYGPIGDWAEGHVRDKTARCHEKTAAEAARGEAPCYGRTFGVKKNKTEAKQEAEKRRGGQAQS